MKTTYRGISQPNWLNFVLLAILAVSVGSLSAAYGQDVSTSFEFNDTSGEFTLGTSPKSVTFTNGLAQVIGVGSLYKTGTHSFMVTSGNTATITFETPAESVALYLKDQSNQSVLTAFDKSNQVISTLKGTTASFTKFEILATSGVLVGSITLQNNGAGFAVIDDFSFTAGQVQQGPNTVLVANFLNGNNDAFNSRVYLWNPSQSAGDVTVRVFTLPLSGGLAQELTSTPLNLGSLEPKSALNVKLVEDILAPLGITTPYTNDGGNLTLEFTIQAANVGGIAQVFASSFAFGTYPLQTIPATSNEDPTVLVANFVNGNDAALDSRIYLWNPSQSAGDVTVRVFTLPLSGGLAQELTSTPLNLGFLGPKSALNVKLAEDILIPLGITTPYTTDGGNLAVEFTIQAANVRGTAQVFSPSFAFGTVPLQVIQ